MKRGIICILSILLTIQAIGCVSQTGDTPETTPGQTESSQDDTTDLSPNLEAKDYGGYEFTIISYKPDGTAISNANFFAEEITGESINDAIFERNLKIENKYGITINSILSPVSECINAVKSSVLSGDDDYDLAEFGLLPSFSAGLNGLLYNVNDLPNIDTSMPWWNQNSITETKVNGKNYFLIGCSDLVAFDSLGVLFFNKELAAENKIDDLYQIVYDGKWTYDKMLEYCLKVSRDLDGNSVFDEKDMYGLAINSYAALTFTYGAGTRFVDPETLKFGFSEKFIDFFEKLCKLPLDNSVMYGENYGTNRVTYMKSAFEENRVLFYNEMLNRTSMLRNMEKDFGILPMPKSDESQEEYTSFCHQTSSASIIVPLTASDVDRTSRILEDMTYESMLSVYPTYIETNVKTKYLRDEDSPKMVDIIINGIHFDITMVSGSSLPNDLRSMLTSSSTAIASTLASKKQSYDEQLAQLLDQN